MLPLKQKDESCSIDFFNTEIEELENQIGTLAGKRFYGPSFVSFVYKHNIVNPLEMTNLPTTLRPLLKEQVKISPLPIKQKQVSRDGTVKFLCEVTTSKGPQDIECVYIPEEKRVTLCVSSQVGCKMGCEFCLTAQLGFKANLKAGDIVRQVWTANQEPELLKITNIVFMGMGEPFDNFEEVKKAIRILTHPRGMNLSARHITVSTVGMVEKINQIQKEDPWRLAVSLNATTDTLRSKLMPINRRWNLPALLEACRQYTKRTNKRITFEYILMEGLTDSLEDAKRLHQLMSSLKCKINLIPYNESSFTTFKTPSEKSIQEFHRYLLDRHHSVFIRKNRGQDIFAACGMLRKVNTIEV